nr:hypothetical protein [Plasmopara viticola lesion associated mononegaambi virus 6]
MESVKLTVSTQIRAFIVKNERDSQLERLMSISLPIGGTMTYVERAKMLQMITDMARLRITHSSVQGHVILQENPQFRQSLSMINDLECLIAAKRQKIIELAGQDIGRENAAYLRSHQFDNERFGRLSIERSFVSPDLFAKWTRLAETVKVASTRLKLLLSILDGVYELFTLIEGEPDYNTIEACIRTTNDRVMRRFVTS